MNRRYFLGLLTSSLGLALSKYSYASSNYSELLNEFVTPYTYPVGKSVLSSGQILHEKNNLESKINHWFLLGDNLHISKLNELIDSDLSDSQFCEIDGWVITQTEALISALIVGTV